MKKEAGHRKMAGLCFMRPLAAARNTETTLRTQMKRYIMQ